MSTVLLIILLITAIVLTGLILIQRSEGGALGIGGGGGGGLMSGRSATTSIARMTGILGAFFIAISLALSVVYEIENRDNLIVDDVTVTQPLTAPTESPETSVPSEAEISTETPTEDAGPEEDE